MHPPLRSFRNVSEGSFKICFFCVRAGLDHSRVVKTVIALGQWRKIFFSKAKVNQTNK